MLEPSETRPLNKQSTFWHEKILLWHFSQRSAKRQCLTLQRFFWQRTCALNRRRQRVTLRCKTSDGYWSKKLMANCAQLWFFKAVSKVFGEANWHYLSSKKLNSLDWVLYTICRETNLFTKHFLLVWTLVRSSKMWKRQSNVTSSLFLLRKKEKFRLGKRSSSSGCGQNGPLQVPEASCYQPVLLRARGERVRTLYGPKASKSKIAILSALDLALHVEHFWFQCVVQSYLQWLQDSDYNANCPFCDQELAEEACVRLVCYRKFLIGSTVFLKSNPAPF